MQQQPGDSSNTSASRLRVGIVGCGYWGSKHTRVLSGRSDVDVVLIDKDQRRIDELSDAFTVTASFNDFEEALSHIDAVVIATPPTAHYPLGKMALENGIHAMVEKPLATSVEEAAELTRIAEANNLTLMVGHTFVFNPSVWKLREIVEESGFGEVLYIYGSRLNLGLYQPDVNVVWDLAPHDISILNYLLRSAPATVSAWGSSHAGSEEREDVAFVQLQYENPKVTATLHVSWLDPCKVRKTTVVGKRRMVVYDDVADEPIRVYDKAVEAPDMPNMHDRPMSYRHGDVLAPFIKADEPLSVELGHFVDCLLSGNTPIADGRAGLDVVRVLVAADKSMAAGGIAINLDEVELGELNDGQRKLDEAAEAKELTDAKAKGPREASAVAVADVASPTPLGASLSFGANPPEELLLCSRGAELAPMIDVFCRRLMDSGFEMRWTQRNEVALGSNSGAIALFDLQSDGPTGGQAVLRLFGFPSYDARAMLADSLSADAELLVTEWNEREIELSGFDGVRVTLSRTEVPESNLTVADAASDLTNPSTSGVATFERN
ncbi:MAG: Gfo/Idh/MocA family oxidoreductase [Acidimicrobiales bacterium]